MDKEQINKLAGLLGDNCSCVICKGDMERHFYGRGVQDLYRLLKESPDFLKDAIIADKVVGKAAAVLMVLGGVKAVYTPLLSSLAVDVFAANNVDVAYDQLVPHIINRDGTDWCPLEKRCNTLTDLSACKKQIDNFLKTATN